MQNCLAGVVWLLAVVAVATVPSHAGVENDIGDEAEKTLIELNEGVLEEYILNNNVEPLQGTVKAEGQLGGRPMPPLTYLSVYANVGGHWRLVARSLTPILAPPPR